MLMTTWLKADRLAVSGERLVPRAQRPQGVAEIVMRGRKSGRGAEGYRAGIPWRSEADELPGMSRTGGLRFL